MWIRELPPSHSRRTKYFAYPQKSLEWLARRTLVGGSSVAKWVGMSPYADGDPVKVFKEGTGAVVSSFEGNIHTKYGERYEPRLRAICIAVLKIDIVEYGLFVDCERPFTSISPDGITPAYRLLGFTDDYPPKSVRIDWKLGRVAWEAKCSRGGLRPAPLIPHIMQLQFQMYILGLHYGLLHYWHCDKNRIWLVEYSPDLLLWMMRRVDLVYQHIKRDSEFNQSNIYCSWKIRPGGSTTYPGSTCSDYLAWAWFHDQGKCKQPPQKPTRPPITYKQWLDELDWLRIHPGYRPPTAPGPDEPGHDGWLYWMSDVPGGAETAPRVFVDNNGFEQCNDAGQQPLPPRPSIWLIYEDERKVPYKEFEFADPDLVSLEDHDPADRAWFEQMFPSVGAYVQRIFDQDEWDYDAKDDDGIPTLAPHFRGVGPEKTRIRRLFVEAFVRLPEADEPEPVDQSANDTPDEKDHFQKRLDYMSRKRSLDPDVEQIDESRKKLITLELKMLLSKVTQ